ncbi:flagellar assembly protein FliH [Candidatus Magnetomorum sp. HK-1]|nr:flagellar assembly protein FliH [Candidatus Magnetomorum sp. HK-1]
MSLSDDVFQFPSFDDTRPSAESEPDDDQKSKDTSEFKLIDFERTVAETTKTVPREDVYHFQSFDDISSQLKECALPAERALQAEITERLKEADDRLKAAEEKFREAEQTIEDARVKSVEIEKQAYEKGISEGKKEGHETVVSQASIIIDGIENVLKEITAYKDDFPKIYEREVIGLIKEIAKKVVHVQAKFDNRVILENIYKAFDILSDRVEVKLNINPGDMDFVNENRPEFFAHVKGIESITIEGDPEVSRGGCFIETRYGDVDARIRTQLERVESSIEELVKNA